VTAQRGEGVVATISEHGGGISGIVDAGSDEERTASSAETRSKGSDRDVTKTVSVRYPPPLSIPSPGNALRRRLSFLGIFRYSRIDECDISMKFTSLL